MLDILLVLVLIAFLTWFAQFHWHRRDLYKAAEKIDGPAGWPILGNVLEFIVDPSMFLNKLLNYGEIYPEIVKLWFGHELLIGVYMPDYLENVLNNPKALAKKDLFYRHLIPIMGTGVVTAPVPKWKYHRKTINPAFNQQVLNKFMAVFSEQSIILVEQLQKFSGKGEFDMTDAISRCTLDVTCETVMGVNVNVQTSRSNYHHVVHRLSEIIASRMTVVWYQFDLLFNLTKYSKEHRELLEVFYGFTKNVITKRRSELKNSAAEVEVEEGNKKRKAFLDLLIKNTDFTEEELIEEVNTFMLGASDTTSLAAGFLFLMLGMHQDVQDKVLHEILDVVGPEREVDLDDLPNLKYTEMVIKETLRLFPGFPIIVRSLDEDIQIKDGLTFPKNSSVLISILGLHREKKYWPDPLKFDPDRFLPEEVAKRHPYCYLPFSAGPRNCIGYKFGMMLLKTMAANCVRKYQISTKFRNVNEVVLKYEVTLGTKNGFRVTLNTR